MMRVMRVYPRAGGGNPGPTSIDFGISGSIPAQGGGTLPHPAPIGKARGLSPRRRGNPVTGAHAGTLTGSIPAQAGEPCSSIFFFP